MPVLASFFQIPSLNCPYLKENQQTNTINSLDSYKEEMCSPLIRPLDNFSQEHSSQRNLNYTSILYLYLYSKMAVLLCSATSLSFQAHTWNA